MSKKKTKKKSIKEIEAHVWINHLGDCLQMEFDNKLWKDLLKHEILKVKVIYEIEE